MKNWSCYLALASALLALSSCAKENLNDEPQEPVTTITAKGLSGKIAKLTDASGKVTELVFNSQGIAEYKSPASGPVVLTTLTVGEQVIRIGRLSGEDITFGYAKGDMACRNDIEGNILIGTVEEFAAIMKRPDELLSGTFLQEADLYFDGVTDWKPIGKDFYTPFTGSYDGNNYKIYNLELAPVAEKGKVVQFTGLFGATKDATIANVTLASGKVTGYRYTAGIVARANGFGGQIVNCHNYAEISGAETVTGGIVAQLQGYTVSDCTNNGKVTGNSEVGGIAGTSNSMKNGLSNCANNGEVNAERGIAGGIIGSSMVPVDDCVNKGTVSGNSSVGGIAGSVSLDTLKNCSNEGKVTARIQGAGGIAGSIGVRGVLFQCANRGTVGAEPQTDESGKVSTPSAVGGICGMSTQGGKILYCTNEEISKIEAVNAIRVGGIVGSSHQDNIEHCVNYAPISSEGECVGGIAGFTYGLLEFCENRADITGPKFVGGVAGFTEQRYGKVRGCVNYGKVTGKGEFTGGVTGVAWGSVSASVNLASVEGVTYTGGVCGAVAGPFSYMVASYNKGEVKGVESVGGAVGEVRQNAKIEACYAVASSIEGQTNVGGFCGMIDDSSQILASYWSGKASAAIASGTGRAGTYVNYFNDGTTAPEGETVNWPSSDENQAWGVGDGKYSNWWKSLGTSGSASYPVLFWE